MAAWPVQHHGADDAVRTSALRSPLALRDERSATPYAVMAALLAVAVAGWWWSARMAGDMDPDRMTGMGGMGGEMSMSLGAFVVAWVAMMAAMMLPAILPVVRLYSRAVAYGRAAPLPFFATGYLAVWSVFAFPAFLAWQALEEPLAQGHAWTGRVAGATLLAAALWQLTPLKSTCLRHCRSPLGFFLRHGGRIRRPTGAARMGALHGAFCFGCCWALFAVLVAVGTMSLLWMVALTALILLERNAPHGHRIALAGAAALAVTGTALLASPSLLGQLT